MNSSGDFSEILVDGGVSSSRAQQSSAARSKLILAMAFCFIFMVVEIVGGFLAGSLAIMTECVVARGLPPRRAAPRRSP